VSRTLGVQKIPNDGSEMSEHLYCFTPSSLAWPVKDRTLLFADKQYHINRTKAIFSQCFLFEAAI